MRSNAIRLALSLAAAALSYVGTTGVVLAQEADADRRASAPAGRVEFDHPGGGAPTVEVDLPAGLWSDVLGLGEAAVAGVAQAIQEAKAGEGVNPEEVKLASEQLAAIRRIVASVQGAIGEVRVRVYRGEGDSAVDGGRIAQHYGEKLAGSQWSRIVHVRDRDKSASVFLMRSEGAIRGVFVVANDGGQLALVNVLCDVSPDRVKQITHEATSVGLELGGDEALRELIDDLHGRRHERPAAGDALRRD